MVIVPNQFKFNCNCGKKHIVALKTAVIEEGVLSDKIRIRKLKKEFGLDGKTAAVYDNNTYKATENVRPEADFEIVLDGTNLHANEKATDYVLKNIGSSVKTLIAVGSGTIHDITRYIAAKLDIPFISVPTAASVDGYVSTVAAMTWGGYKLTMPAVAPVILIADLNIIKNAPKKLTESGIGDISGKYTALADWKIARLLTGEYFCEEIYALMKNAADRVRESYRDLTVINNSDQKRTQAYENIMYALILSGIAMQLSGNSRPASGAEHHISHTTELNLDWLNMVDPTFLHGERVGAGTIMCIKKYKKWLDTEVDQIEFVNPNDSKYFAEIFGGQLKSVTKENSDDCIKKVNLSDIKEKWNSIKEIIAEIPQAFEIENMLAVKTLSDIGITDNETVEKLLYWSPYVRNRLTFSRISHYLKTNS